MLLKLLFWTPATLNYQHVGANELMNVDQGAHLGFLPSQGKHLHPFLRILKENKHAGEFLSTLINNVSEWRNLGSLRNFKLQIVQTEVKDVK